MRIIFIFLTLMTFLSIEQTAIAGMFDGTNIHAYARKGDFKKIKKAIEQKGVSINLADDRGDTALHFAAWKNHPGIVKYLIKKGAKVDLYDNAGSTPLMLATIFGNSNIVAQLIQAGADVNATKHASDNMTPAMLAAYNKKTDVLKLLIENGADLSFTTTKGETALSFAKAENATQVIQMLNANQATEGTKVVVVQNKKTTRGKRSLEPVACIETPVDGLEGDQSKALSYVVRKKYEDRLGMRSDRICIENIEIQDTFKLRGNTVVKYIATIMLPYGYKADCISFNKRKNKQFSWENYTKSTTHCSALDQVFGGGIKPSPPGKKYRYKGEETI